MFTKSQFVVLGLLLGGLVACSKFQADLPDFWIEDLERGTALAAEDGRPMLVVFR